MAAYTSDDLGSHPDLIMLLLQKLPAQQTQTQDDSWHCTNFRDRIYISDEGLHIFWHAICNRSSLWDSQWQGCGSRKSEPIAPKAYGNITIYYQQAGTNIFQRIAVEVKMWPHSFCGKILSVLKLSPFLKASAFVPESSHVGNVFKFILARVAHANLLDNFLHPSEWKVSMAAILET